MSTFSLLLILIVSVSILLVLVVMVQNPKGGGLSSSFGGADTNVVGGVQKTGNFLDKSTWTLATILICLILLSNSAIKTINQPINESLLENPIEDKNTELPTDLSDDNSAESTVKPNSEDLELEETSE